MGKIKVKYLWIGIAILFVVGCALVFGVTQTEGFWTDVVIVLIAADFINMTIAIQVATSRTFKFKAKPIDYDKKEYEFSKGIEVTLKKLGYRQKEAVYGHNYLKVMWEVAYKIVFVKDFEKYFNQEETPSKSSNKELEKCKKFIGVELFLKYDEDTLNKLPDFCLQGENVYYAGFYFDSEKNVLVCPNYIEPSDNFKEHLNVIHKDLNMIEKE